VQFFSRILAFFRNHYYIDAYSVFRWCFTTFVSIANKRTVQIFQMHSKSEWSLVIRNSSLLGTILHLRKFTLCFCALKRNFNSYFHVCKVKFHCTRQFFCWGTLTPACLKYKTSTEEYIWNIHLFQTGWLAAVVWSYCSLKF
jgi:hypothetical protein